MAVQLSHMDEKLENSYEYVELFFFTRKAEFLNIFIFLIKPFFKIK